MDIYIPSDVNKYINKKHLFILVRPFYSKEGWVINDKQLQDWGIDSSNIRLVLNLDRADLMLLPYFINYYICNGLYHKLKEYNSCCIKNNIKAFGFVAGDYGEQFPEFDNIIYFRMGGFRSQLSERNIGLPAALSDHNFRLFGSNNINLRKKNKKLVIGFCGQSDSSQIKRSKDSIMYIFENIKRFISNPDRSDYETIFSSAYHRYQILNNLECSKLVYTNFIHRKKYRAGAISEYDMHKTTLEYYNNIRESDYILCLRGGGNYSIRFYETLLMGRIPVFINTDCILPLMDKINWKEHVVWIEWEERHQIAEIVAKFHNDISSDDFRQIQLSNRKLWLEKLQPAYILTHCLQ